MTIAPFSASYVADTAAAVKLGYGLGTLSTAIFTVLQKAGASGLRVKAIMKEILREGLYRWAASKTPKQAVSAELRRDANFQRVARGTYALRGVPYSAGAARHEAPAARKAAAAAAPTVTDWVAEVRQRKPAHHASRGARHACLTEPRMRLRPCV